MTKKIENQLTRAYHYDRMYEIEETKEYYERSISRLNRFFSYYLDIFNLEFDHGNNLVISFYNKKLDEYINHSRILDLCNYYLAKK